MATGLIALLDDVAAIAKLAAASLDDVAAQTAKATTKAAGIVIDDAAVTPRYVVGLSPARELPIIGRIALGSLKNKLVFLLPAALLLGYFAPWVITPLLMVGGIYLCYEGAEKLYVFGGIATIYTIFMIIAGGLQYVLLSAILYAPGTILYVWARRERGERLFTPVELGIFVIAVVGCAFGIYGLASGSIVV
jgi:hypothetical protein